MKTKIQIIIISLLCTLSLSAQNKATHITVKNPERAFVGAVLEYKSINTDEHRFVNVTVPEPITISFSIPIKSQTITPSYENMMKAVRESVMASGKIKSQQNFSFQLKEIKSYEELYWYFGQTINTSTFLGIPVNTKPQKIIAVVDLTQEYFSINMDFPDNGKLYDKDPQIAKQIDDLIYLGHLSFGRKVTVVVESEMPFFNLKSAIEEAITSEEKPISKRSYSILANADIRIMVLGNLSLPKQNPDNPFSAVISYFQKPVTIDDFGVPLRFSATYIKDNSVFENEY
ncbi:MAG: hemolysin [Bacteroidia bacterium]|nr:hemolysin [Bacteroidia bacterium]